MIICQNKQGVTEFLPEEKRVVCTYQGKSDKDLSIEHLSKIVDFYAQEPREVDVAIVDVRNLYGSYYKLMGYFATTFYPAMSKTSLKAQVIIVKDDAIVNHLARKLISITELSSIKSRIFFTMEEAEAWIGEVLKK